MRKIKEYKDSHQIWSAFDVENDWWWINIDQLIFCQGCQPESLKKGQLDYFLDSLSLFIMLGTLIENQLINVDLEQK